MDFGAVPGRRQATADLAGGFIDPFGHLWLVGERSPLERHDQR
jgi:hypothetical protein